MCRVASVGLTCACAQVKLKLPLRANVHTDVLVLSIWYHKSCWSNTGDVQTHFGGGHFVGVRVGGKMVLAAVSWAAIARAFVVSRLCGLDGRGETWFRGGGRVAW